MEFVDAMTEIIFTLLTKVDWRILNVLPLFKKGSRDKTYNTNRLVSLTPWARKLIVLQNLFPINGGEMGIK